MTGHRLDPYWNIITRALASRGDIKDDGDRHPDFNAPKYVVWMCEALLTQLRSAGARDASLSEVLRLESTCTGADYAEKLARRCLERQAVTSETGPNPPPPFERGKRTMEQLERTLVEMAEQGLREIKAFDMGKSDIEQQMLLSASSQVSTLTEISMIQDSGLGDEACRRLQEINQEHLALLRARNERLFHEPDETSGPTS